MNREILITEDETQLVLPSGAKVGHRAYSRYYRQNLRPQEQRESVINNQLISQYRALGWHGMNPEERAVSKLAQRVQHRRTQDWKLKMGVKHNNQKHFRDPLLQ